MQILQTTDVCIKRIVLYSCAKTSLKMVFAVLGRPSVTQKCSWMAQCNAWFLSSMLKSCIFRMSLQKPSSTIICKSYVSLSYLGPGWQLAQLVQIQNVGGYFGRSVEETGNTEVESWWGAKGEEQIINLECFPKPSLTANPNDLDKQLLYNTHCHGCMKNPLHIPTLQRWREAWR